MRNYAPKIVPQVMMSKCTKRKNRFIFHDGSLVRFNVIFGDRYL